VQAGEPPRKFNKRATLQCIDEEWRSSVEDGAPEWLIFSATLLPSYSTAPNRRTVVGLLMESESLQM